AKVTWSRASAGVVARARGKRRAKQAFNANPRSPNVRSGQALHTIAAIAGMGVANLNLDSRPRQELQVEPETAARRIAPNTTPADQGKDKTLSADQALALGLRLRAKGRISSASEGSI